jgi:hypothetical protein
MCLFLILIIPAVAFAEEQEEFILGLWHTFEACCMAGHPYCNCCLDTLWGQDTIPPIDRAYIDTIGANTLHSHYYGLNDFLPVLRYCESTDGRVKMYAGLEWRGLDKNGYEEMGRVAAKEIPQLKTLPF